MPRFRFNETFAPVFFSEARVKDIWGGRGRGGSHFATDYALFLLTQPAYFRGLFIRKTFNDIRGSLYRDIKDRIAENDTLNPADFTLHDLTCCIQYKPTGNTITSKGLSNDRRRTAKLKSVAGVTHAFIEEADELSAEEFDQLNASLRTTKTGRIEIIRVFNPPPKSHWIWRDYTMHESEVDGWFRPVVKSDADILSIYSTYHDNLRNLHPSAVRQFEAFKESNPDYYYNQICGLVSEGARGRIYRGWLSMPDGEFDALDLPHVYTVDFGYSEDPTAVMEIKWEKTTRYCRELLYEKGLCNADLAVRLRALGVSEKDLVVADYGAGGDLRIAELRRGIATKEGALLRFNIRPCIKGSGTIKAGIDKVRSSTTCLTEGSRNGWREYEEYKWLLDADKLPTDQPVDAYNHLMDCRRYFELAKGRLF